MNKNQQIVNALTDYLTKKELSQNQLAQMMDISAATISQMRKGEWDLISPKMWNRVSSFLKIDAWKLFDTMNNSTVRNLCMDAQENARFIALSAKSGYGKTSSLLAYQKENPNVFYVLGHILMAGRKQFLQAIQQALGIVDGSNPADMLTAIIEHLNGCASPLLIIDDASKLNDSNLRILQLIYDQTEGRLGIIIAGTEYLQWYLTKSLSKNKMGFEELFRRIESWQPLFPPRAEEVVTICKANGIDQREMVKYIIANAKNFGTLKALITNATRLLNKGKLTVEAMALTHKPGAEA